jgi:hypothetical protein
MDLKTYKFPKLTGVDVVFSTLNTDPVLLAEAKKRGFYYKNTPYNDLFSDLFFSGGKLNLKKDLPPEFEASAIPYLKALMASFEPSHEDKNAVCAMLLSELIDL